MARETVIGTFTYGRCLSLKYRRVSASENQLRRAASMTATSIFSFSSSPQTRALPHCHQPPSPQSTARRDLPGDAPFILAPAARALLATIANDCVPVPVGFLLVVGGDLTRERPAREFALPIVLDRTDIAMAGSNLCL
jgi:hypothetical protein